MVSEFVHKLKSLSDEFRFMIFLELLKSGKPLNVNEIVRRMDTSQTRVSRSLNIMKNAGMLTSERKGVHIFHLLADLHGRGQDGMFVLELIREAHGVFVDAGIRQEVTLIGGGGFIAAEHIPKGILCGLDVISLDSALFVALQGIFDGECADRDRSQFRLPKVMSVAWGKQRLLNLSASWRDQLLEISGAMGIREVRRMRGEMGRAMFMVDLEAQAFAGIDGYESR